MNPDEVVALARTRPWAEQAWATGLLERFPEQLAQALVRWGLTIERVHLDGAGLPVLTVRLGTGRQAVLKFNGGGTDLAQQVRVLTAADGRGYVRVLDHDLDLGAALLERLGPSLAETTLDPVAQTDVLVGLLERAWALPLEIATPTRPQEKACALLTLLEEELAAPSRRAERHTPILCRAADLARHLASSPAPQQVVVHGDPHSLNALQRNGSHVLIDPDGFRCEREYDAGVVLRDLAGHVDELDRSEGNGAGRRWHATLVNRVVSRLELDRERVGAWALVERTTTGVWLSRLGYATEGEAWLATADRM